MNDKLKSIFSNPKDYMRTNRPELFSDSILKTKNILHDSILKTKNILHKTILEYQLDTLTSRPGGADKTIHLWANKTIHLG